MSAPGTRKPWLRVARVLAAIMQEREPHLHWRPVGEDDPGRDPSVVERDDRPLGERDTSSAN
jgi:hypothetical protein